MRKVLFYTLIVLVIFLSACNKNRKLELSSSEPSNKTAIIRFDSALLNIDTTTLLKNTKELYQNYPQFMPFFVSEIMGSEPTDTIKTAKLISEFLKNKDFVNVNSDVKKTFSNIDSIKNDIETAYEYLNQYFPEIKTPEVYFYVSGFNRPIILEKEFVGVSLDLYLGSDYPKYKDITYNYMMFNMRPSSIAPDLISAILFQNFKYEANQDRLLENMLYRGKIMYLLSQIMPNLEPNNVIGYSKFQWEWCRKFEEKIWNTIVVQKDLYSTDLMLINKYMNDAPFTAPVSQESPGRLGTWVGLQIINSYMKNNPEISINQLIKNNDYQQILNKSDYQP